MTKLDRRCHAVEHVRTRRSQLSARSWPGTVHLLGGPGGWGHTSVAFAIAQTLATDFDDAFSFSSIPPTSDSRGRPLGVRRRRAARAAECVLAATCRTRKCCWPSTIANTSSQASRSSPSGCSPKRRWFTSSSAAEKRSTCLMPSPPKITPRLSLEHSMPAARPDRVPLPGSRALLQCCGARMLGIRGYSSLALRRMKLTAHLAVVVSVITSATCFAQGSGGSRIASAPARAQIDRTSSIST